MQLNLVTCEGASDFSGLSVWNWFFKKIRIPGASILRYRSSDAVAFACAIKAGRAT